ncbi:MAG: YIP1 family protein [Desulfarculaceae bacterium]|nr:YIP1 family protein [Desulfarculaceae bacterium]MCF8073118.1 YIP1 family protein [Desulfarculaceae bacterium]MCF8101797.1 YIP1 family protein [Desulfarculaceae bacterium]MCF8117361.1 YIP1 family protein [Desulfarculaceae bacterium]
MAAYCPYCGSEMDGESAGGSGLPGTATCPTCRQEVDLPSEPPRTPPFMPPRLEEPPGEPLDYVPWEGEGGFFGRLLRTIGRVLAHPVLFFRAPARPGWAWALSFGLILGTLGQALQIFWGHHLGGASGMHYDSLRSALVALIFSPLTALVSMFLVAWITHFCLWILRGANNGVRATFRVMAYGQATNIFMLVPFVGMVLMPVWGLVLAIGGLAGAHGIGRWRAFFAIFLPLVVIIGFSVAAVLVLLAVGIGSELLDKLQSLPNI